MDYEYIRLADSTLSANVSEITLREICERGWRCYSSVFVSQTETLIQRFLASHARMPGVLTEEMLALIPIDILRYTNKENGVRVEGATFTNGAVVTVLGTDGTSVKLLFIDDVTAERWKYPDGHQYLGRENGSNPSTVSS